MTPDEHAAEAERLVADCVNRDGYADDSGAGDIVANTLRAAQVHATLALRGPDAHVLAAALRDVEFRIVDDGHGGLARIVSRQQRRDDRDGGVTD